MTALDDKTEIKVIGASGQISLGKQFAGRTVLVEQLEPGVWRIRTASVIPDNEQWLYAPEDQAKLQKAMRWADEHPVEVSDESDLNALRAKSEGMP